MARKERENDPEADPSTVAERSNENKRSIYDSQAREEAIREMEMEPGFEGVLLSDNEEARLTERGLEFVRFYRNGQGEISSSRSWIVLMGNFKPVRVLKLDGEEVFEMETHSKFRGNAEEINQELRRQGRVVNRAKAADCVNALFMGMNIPTEKGHAAFGVFNSREEGVHLCLDPYPRTESQEQIARELERGKNEELTADRLKAWLKLLDFWHEYEVLPVIGLSVMAPFALELRGRGMMVPYMYHLSPESGLGKSETIMLFSTLLFGNSTMGEDSVRSQYRLMDALDSSGLIICIEEAEALPWGKYSAHLQQAAERKLQDKRGTPGLGSRPYLSRAVLGFSANHLTTRKKSLLVRLLVVEFDRKSLQGRIREKKKLTRAKKKLRKIGFRVVEAELESLGSIEDLVDRVENHADKIEEHYPSSFKDPRRSTAWGIVYEGLKAWERAARKVGVDWKAPGYEEFVESVVSRVETTAFEAVEVPAQRFITWWRAWKAMNTQIRDREEVIKGEGKIWERKEEGDVITKEILSLYEKDTKARGEIPINSMPDLAKGVEALYGKLYSDVYKDWKVGGKTKKGVLIPSEEENPPAFSELSQEDRIKTVKEALEFFHNNEANEEDMADKIKEKAGVEKVELGVLGKTLEMMESQREVYKIERLGSTERRWKLL